MYRYKNNRFLSVVESSLLIIILSSGCASTAHFNNTPVDEAEFYKDRAYLEKKYPDIDKYDRMLAPTRESPPLSELETKWGQPTEKHTRWDFYALGWMAEIGFVASGYLTPFVLGVNVIAPFPGEKYIWEKGIYKITAYSNRDMVGGYEKRMHSWEWEPRSSNENSKPKDTSEEKTDAHAEIVTNNQ